MIGIEERQSEGAGLNSGKIDRDKSEAGALHRVQYLRAKRIAHRSDEISEWQLDPRDVIVVANSQLSESELPQRRLGAFDLA
jgi:hypothetical protein